MIFSFLENLWLYAFAANKLFYETAPDLREEREEIGDRRERERGGTADTIRHVSTTTAAAAAIFVIWLVVIPTLYSSLIYVFL